jgi:hypothetical protein
MDLDFFAWILYWPVKLLSRVFCIGPRISRDGQSVVASSNFLSQLLCLGFAGRRVTIDPRQGLIRVHYRVLWVLTRSRRIEFDWISHVVYDYSGMGGWYGAYQEGEVYSVALKLKNGQEVLLFQFVGEGDFVNNTVWPDWMYWVEFKVAQFCQGPQEARSLMYAETVSRLAGVPLGEP